MLGFKLGGLSHCLQNNILPCLTRSEWVPDLLYFRESKRQLQLMKHVLACLNNGHLIPQFIQEKLGFWKLYNYFGWNCIVFTYFQCWSYSNHHYVIYKRDKLFPFTVFHRDIALWWNKRGSHQSCLIDKSSKCIYSP